MFFFSNKKKEISYINKTDKKNRNKAKKLMK